MDPLLLSLVIISSAAGSVLGLVSGLVPGIHVNTLAALLLSSYAPISEAIGDMVPDVWIPTLVCCCIVAAGVVHSFVDFVPSVFLGAPDSEDAVSVLPGHRMLLQGLGQEAVSAAAIGSIVGCSAAIAIAIPMQYAMLNGAYGIVDAVTPAVLGIAAFVLVAGEFRKGRMPGLFGAAAFLISGAIGYACMTEPIPVDGILGEGSIMFPMLTGLFGLPILLSAADGGKQAPQRRGREDPVGIWPGLKGVATGCIAGWFPGITSTVGASMAASVMPESRPERFIATVASIGTVTSVLALVTLSVSGRGRTGIALAVWEVAGDSVSGFMSPTFLALLLAAAVASLAGFYLTIASGRAFSRAIGRLDQRRMNMSVAILVSVLVLLLTGPYGLAVMVLCSVAGFIPNVCGTGRAVLCGSLLLPAILFRLRAWTRPWT